MKNETLTTHLVTRRDQLDALISPVRLEIVDCFEAGEALSVRQVAELMGRPPASLHFHVKKLADVGLLRESGTRGQGPRTEKLYRLIAPRIAVAMRPRSRASVEAAVRGASTILRLAAREFASAAESGHWGTASMVCGGRRRLWLSDTALRELARRMESLDRYLATQSKKREGRQYSWTSLLVPLGARDGKGKKK